MWFIFIYKERIKPVGRCAKADHWLFMTFTSSAMQILACITSAAAPAVSMCRKTRCRSTSSWETNDLRITKFKVSLKVTSQVPTTTMQRTSQQRVCSMHHNQAQTLPYKFTTQFKKKKKCLSELLTGTVLSLVLLKYIAVFQSALIACYIQMCDKANFINELVVILL